MSDVRFACSECGFLPDIDPKSVPDACPHCGDELLDLENGSDRHFLADLFKQRAMTRGLKALGIGFIIGLIALIPIGMAVPELLQAADLIMGAVAMVTMAPVDRFLRRKQPPAVFELEEAMTREAINLRNRMWTGAPVLVAALIVLIFAVVPFELMLDSMALVPKRVQDGQGLGSLFAYGLAHGDWLHVLLNAVGILAFGIAVDLRLGRMLTLFVVGATVVGAGVGEVFLSTAPETPIVGISAAVYGLMGASLVLMPRMKRAIFLAGMPVTVPQWVLLPLLVVIYTGLGWLAQVNVAHIAHLVGFGVGIALALGLRLVPEPAAFVVYKDKLEETMAELARM